MTDLLIRRSSLLTRPILNRRPMVATLSRSLLGNVRRSIRPLAAYRPRIKLVQRMPAVASAREARSEAEWRPAPLVWYGESAAETLPDTPPVRRMPPPWRARSTPRESRPAVVQPATEHLESAPSRETSELLPRVVVQRPPPQTQYASRQPEPPTERPSLGAGLVRGSDLWRRLFPEGPGFMEEIREKKAAAQRKEERRTPPPEIPAKLPRTRTWEIKPGKPIEPAVQRAPEVAESPAEPEKTAPQEETEPRAEPPVLADLAAETTAAERPPPVEPHPESGAPESGAAEEEPASAPVVQRAPETRDAPAPAPKDSEIAETVEHGEAAAPEQEVPEPPPIREVARPALQPPVSPEPSKGELPAETGLAPEAPAVTALEAEPRPAPAGPAAPLIQKAEPAQEEPPPVEPSLTAPETAPAARPELEPPEAEPHPVREEPAAAEPAPEEPPAAPIPSAAEPALEPATFPPAPPVPRPRVLASPVSLKADTTQAVEPAEKVSPALPATLPTPPSALPLRTILPGPVAAPARVPERLTPAAEVRPFVERPPSLVSLKPRQEAKPRLFELPVAEPAPLPLRLPVTPPPIQRQEDAPAGEPAAESEEATRPESPDVARLAREVYQMLKRRLIVEREQFRGF